MSFLQDMLKNELNDMVKDQLAVRAGVPSEKSSGVVDDVVSALLGGLKSNVKTKDGATSLDAALSKDHDGSILGDILGMTSKKSVQTDGSKIIGHIFGSQENKILDGLSKKTGLSKEILGTLMAVIAPIILGKLGQTKKANALSAEDIADEISSEKGPNDGLLDSFGGMLDRDGDGSIVDDVIDIGSSLFGKKK